MAIFTLLGLLLLCFMGCQEETMQTIALMLAFALIALFIGIPLGIYAAT
ncbi:MAG: hypothetical protein ACLFVR_15565 [Thiohalospira sp.]